MPSPTQSPQTFDFVIIGSGFGGSVSAMRLAQKGYRVALIEEGLRWKNSEHPKTNWDVRKFLWAPLLRCFGIQKITFLKRLMVLHGAGVGGGSLVYANTLMKPADSVFQSPSWPAGLDWKKELDPYYTIAKKILGVATNPRLADADLATKQLAKEMGVEKTFHPTEVGIFFGPPGKEVPDPYFSGDGPARTGCTFCGSCMIGCPNGAKNTLDKNYLYFAEKWGTQIFSGLKAIRIQPQTEGGYAVSTQAIQKGNTSLEFQSKRVIVAAGVLGTLKLLFWNRDRLETLPHLSPCLGQTVQSNGESLLGVTSLQASQNFSQGIAIGSAIHPDENTKIEPVRYPPGSDFMRLLAVPLAGDGSPLIRGLKMVGRFFTHPIRTTRALFTSRWSERTIILLVMQTIESRLALTLGRFGLKRQSGEIPSYLPVAQTAAKKLARIVSGEPLNVFSEVFFRTPATAHILGGALMGHSPSDSVVNPNHEVHGYPGLYVCDASVIPANLGVNPSLTITALAERFAAQFPLNSARDDSKPLPILRFSPDFSSQGVPTHG